MDLREDQYQTLNDCFYQWGMLPMAELTPDEKFAHYTSASVAMSIINGQTEDRRCLWLRNATLMNDFSEVEYGQHLLKSALAHREVGPDLKRVCADIHPDIINVFTDMDREVQSIRQDTFLLSLALHRDIELSRGKLSMWRAYGGDANVCLLLNTAPFVTEQNAYDVTASPVDYGGFDSFKEEMIRIITTMYRRRDELREIGPATVKLNLKQSIDNMVLSSKHPGFQEESEWRVIKRRAYWPDVDSTPSQVVDVGGVQQEVFYLPMRNLPDKGVVGAELNEILHGIIVGPTSNPDLVRRAFIRALGEAGVEHPHDRVLTCGIPLRR